MPHRIHYRVRGPVRGPSQTRERPCEGDRSRAYSRKCATTPAGTSRCFPERAATGTGSEGECLSDSQALPRSTVHSQGCPRVRVRPQLRLPESEKILTRSQTNVRLAFARSEGRGKRSLSSMTRHCIRPERSAREYISS